MDCLQSDVSDGNNSCRVLCGSMCVCGYSRCWFVALDLSPHFYEDDHMYTHTHIHPPAVSQPL